MPKGSIPRACVAGALTFAAVSLYFLGALILRHAHPYQWVGSTATLCVPAFAAIAAYRYVRRGAPTERREHRLPRRQRAVLFLGVAAYALTAAVGVPAVQSDLSAWAVAECDRIYAEPDVVRPEGVPYVEVHVAVPVLPGLVLAYYSYTIAGLYGLEAWGLYGWYGTGTTRLAEGHTGIS